MKKTLAVCALAVLWSTAPLLAAPSISSFTPAFGSASDPSYIFINGNGFSPGTLVVRFNGVQDPGAFATAGTLIQARVPAGATNGANPIFVSVNGAGVLSSQDFTVIGPGPYISDFSPITGSGNTPVTINGAHFTTPLAVYFNGLLAPGANAPALTQITVNAPSGVTTGPITVQTTLGYYTSATNFYVPPIVTGFSPAAGRSGTNVIITGTNFLGTSAVRFNGLDATSFNVLSNRAISAVVPVGVTTGTLRIIAPAASALSSSNFVVQPTITGFAPIFGPVGSGVTITGANFNVGTPVVKFSGAQAGTPTGVTFGQLSAIVPAGATNGPVTVTTTDGIATSASNFFLPPTISTIAPSNSAPGTRVSIKGNNYIGTTAVTFNGTPAAAVVVTNNTSIGALVPPGVTSGPIRVTTPGGTATSAANFFGAPVIISFNPTHGLPGNNVSLTGQNFLGTGAVRFNGSNATFTLLNNTTLNATVPNNALTGTISVTAPAGTATSAQSFALDYTANLSLTVSDDPDPVVVGDPLLYTITVVNNGPYATPGVFLTNTLPATVNLLAASTSQGALNTNANPVIGDLGQLEVGASASVTFEVVPQAVGSIANTAQVTAQYPDPVLANNTVTIGTLVQPLPLLSVRFVPPNQVILAWASTLTNYALEFKSPITSAAWSAVLPPPVNEGNENQVTETNNLSPRYYRLHRRP